jgi:signal transduction histidine kinase
VGFGNRTMTVRIKDDGKGFSVKKLKTLARDHFGLLGMRRRVRLLGGTLRITSTPGKGTCVSISLPFKRSDTSLPSKGGS